MLVFGLQPLYLEGQTRGPGSRGHLSQTYILAGPQSHHLCGEEAEPRGLLCHPTLQFREVLGGGREEGARKS